MIEQKIEKLIEEATRFAKEFSKASPMQKTNMARMISPSMTPSKSLVSELSMNKTPSLSSVNSTIRDYRDRSVNNIKERTETRNNLFDKFKKAGPEMRDKMREVNFGFQRDYQKFNKARETGNFSDRYTFGPKESLKIKKQENFWKDNFDGLYKKDSLKDKLADPIQAFKDRNKPILPFDKTEAVTGGGKYTLDSLLNRRNTDTFKNQIHGQVWANPKAKDPTTELGKIVDDHYRASKFGTYTDRNSWDVPAHATFDIPHEQRKTPFGSNQASPLEFTIAKNDIKNISNLKINEVTPEQQKNEGVWLDKEWSLSNPDRTINANVPGRMARYDDAKLKIPNNYR